MRPMGSWRNTFHCRFAMWVRTLPQPSFSSGWAVESSTCQGYPCQPTMDCLSEPVVLGRAEVDIPPRLPRRIRVFLEAKVRPNKVERGCTLGSGVFAG